MQKNKILLVITVLLLWGNCALAQSTGTQNCFKSIMDFGAKMDGESDDSPAIMASLKAMDYAYIPANENGARVEKTIILKGNQNLYGISRASTLNSYVPKGTYTVRAEYVKFRESVQIKDLTIAVHVKDANGIQAYATRNVYIDNVAIWGKDMCNVGIQLNGGEKKGSAWNQLFRYTISRCKMGIELTSNTKGLWCNRNYIGFGVIQSCETGLRLYRGDTNTILACPQDCPVGITIEKSRANTIDTIVENSKINCIKIDSKSNYNTISGQFMADKYSDMGTGNELNLNRRKNKPIKLN